MPTTTPPSPARLAANRSNALRSTGPRTPSGKARSSRNATTHGLSQSLPPAAPSPLLPTEDPALYAAFRSALLSDLDPQSPLELDLADRIVSLHWRLRRCPAIEAELAGRHVELRRRAHEAQQDQRYVRTRDRAPFAPPPAVEFLANQFSSHDDRANPLARLHRYETSLDRTLRRCTADYRTLQLTRQAAADVQEDAEGPIADEIEQNEPTAPPRGTGDPPVSPSPNPPNKPNEPTTPTTLADPPRDAGVPPAPPSPTLQNEPNPLSPSPHLPIPPSPSSASSVAPPSLQNEQNEPTPPTPQTPFP